MAGDYDAIIVGAGMSGLYQLYKLRQLGMSVRVFEAGGDVGGTWYWNRYPGARFDSESYSYGYSFSKELLAEWEWSEHFSPQPETLKYVNHVADRFDLRRDIQFNCRIENARWDEESEHWCVGLPDGSEVTSRFFITAIGVLSVPQLPSIPGMQDFEGDSWHTARWPHKPVSFEGKRVAVIGTGATAVQLIQEVAKTADQLTIFQRRPNWCAPLHNSPITSAQQAEIRATQDEIFELCRDSHGGFIHRSDPREALEISAQERDAFYEQRYNEPGFGIWMGNFRDVMINEEANKTLSDFVAAKIRERVDDPVLAEKLIPTDHGFGTRRVPMETRYYEVFNQPNVELVDLRETPITGMNARGIECGDTERDFDLVVYATGFDAVTGAFEKMDVRGVGGVRLADTWQDGPRTYLGLSVPGFPNLLTLVGPHNAATFCNMPRCIEQNVDWVSDFLGHMRESDYAVFEASLAGEKDWTQHVHESSERMLFTRIDSWFMGYNPNREDKTERRFLVYAAGVPAYRERCDEVANSAYAGFNFRKTG